MATKRLKELLEARKSAVRENSGVNHFPLLPLPFFSPFSDLKIKNVV